jgi:hypothetical protein
VSIGTRVCQVTWFVEVASSRAKAVFAEKVHIVIPSFMGLTCSKLSDNIGWIGTMYFSCIISLYLFAPGNTESKQVGGNVCDARLSLDSANYS